jgi:DNA-directed RNA polymerase subunit RPC12/RpoP
MGYAEATGFCKTCDRKVMIRRRTPNHILHLLLAIVTAGLWIIVWVLVSLQIGGWRCSQCGTRTARKMFS